MPDSIHAVLLDPYDLFPGHDVDRIPDVARLPEYLRERTG